MYNNINNNGEQYDCVDNCNKNGNKRKFTNSHEFCIESCEEEFHFENDYICYEKGPFNSQNHTTLNGENICEKWIKK